jgi:hypothetical protein
MRPFWEHEEHAFPQFIFLHFPPVLSRTRGPVGGPPGPSPKFIFEYVNRTPPKRDFPLLQPEISSIYLQSALISLSLIHVSFNA